MFIRKLCFALVFLAICYLDFGSTVCPPCPKNTMPCHQPVLVRSQDKKCTCSTCLTRCPPRGSICKSGEACVLESVLYDKKVIGKTATCKPFEQCPETSCTNQCPESGFYVDSNGCSTCLCRDPCQELKCPGSCTAFSVNPGTEPNFTCE